MEIRLFGLVFYLPHDHTCFFFIASSSSVSAWSTSHLMHQFNIGAPYGLVLHPLYTKTVLQLAKKITRTFMFII
jgi:hypothetical protein